jgi:ribosomal protein S18 acetylase RimI-like enzyme
MKILTHTQNTIPTNPQMIASVFKAVKGEKNIEILSPAHTDLFQPDIYQIRMASTVDEFGIGKLIPTVKAYLETIGKSHFLKDKTQKDIANLLSKTNSGIVLQQNNIIVGFALISKQSEQSGACNVPAQFNNGKFLTIGSVAIDPDHSGHGLGKILVKKAFEAAVASTYLNMGKDGFETVIAKVATDNIPSQKAFEANGFTKLNVIFHDKAGGYHFEIWQNNIPPHPALAEKPAEYMGGERERRFAQTLADRAGKNLTHC